MPLVNPKSSCAVLSILLFAVANLSTGHIVGTGRLYAEERNPRVATTVESRTVSVRISRPWHEVNEFLSNPENWNAWAHGLGKTIRPSQGRWIADTQEGTIEVRFTPKNTFGIVDHFVRRKSGAEIYVPMRLIHNGTGCELLFTLFREPGTPEDKYADDLEFVKRDLDELRTVLEK